MSILTLVACARRVHLSGGCRGAGASLRIYSNFVFMYGVIHAAADAAVTTGVCAEFSKDMPWTDADTARDERPSERRAEGKWKHAAGVDMYPDGGGHYSVMRDGMARERIDWAGSRMREGGAGGEVGRRSRGLGGSAASMAGVEHGYRRDRRRSRRAVALGGRGARRAAIEGRDRADVVGRGGKHTGRRPAGTLGNKRPRGCGRAGRQWGRSDSNRTRRCITPVFVR